MPSTSNEFALIDLRVIALLKTVGSIRRIEKMSLLFHFETPVISLKLILIVILSESWPMTVHVNLYVPGSFSSSFLLTGPFVSSSTKLPSIGFSNFG